MNGRIDFNTLLADEDFQNGIINFEDFSEKDKKAFIRKYSINRSEFSIARNIITGLTYSGIQFSDVELTYLWKSLGLEKSGKTIRLAPPLRKFTSLISKVAAILFVPLLIGSLWLAYKASELQSYKEEKVDQLSAKYNTIYAPPGGKTRAILPDGSEVWLNSGSSIQYPLLSNNDYREVKLSGEGLFKVVKNPEKPMVVSTSAMQIKVYGTTFNVNAYEDQSVFETALVEGQISIIKLDENGKPTHEEYKMKPGEYGKIDRRNNKIEIKDAGDMDIYTGWVEGKYVFKNIPFREILKRLQRIHNVDLVLEDEKLGDYNFDATFGDQNIEGIMEIFAISLPIKWTMSKVTQNNDQTFTKKRILITRDNSKAME